MIQCQLHEQVQRQESGSSKNEITHVYRRSDESVVKLNRTDTTLDLSHEGKKEAGEETS